jgi:hypothetical protein
VVKIGGDGGKRMVKEYWGMPGYAINSAAGAGERPIPERLLQRSFRYHRQGNVAVIEMENPEPGHAFGVMVEPEVALAIESHQTRFIAAIEARRMRQKEVDDRRRAVTVASMTRPADPNTVREERFRAAIRQELGERLDRALALGK